jgi:hypothetical protein
VGLALTAAWAAVGLLDRRSFKALLSSGKHRLGTQHLSNKTRKNGGVNQTVTWFGSHHMRGSIFPIHWNENEFCTVHVM